MIAFMVVDLPAPLRPISATTSPRRPRSQVKQDLRGAVPGAEPVDREHGVIASSARCSRSLAGAEIDFLHLRDVADRCGVAVGDQPAARQHDDAIGEGEHHIHRMLGEQHRDAALDDEALHQRDQIVALARRHAGGRLVHQQQRGSLASAMASSTA
jgi:hypothetical protein